MELEGLSSRSEKPAFFFINFSSFNVPFPLFAILHLIVCSTFVRSFLSFFFHSSFILCLSSIHRLSFSLVLFLHLFNFLVFLIYCPSLSSFSLLLFIFNPRPSSRGHFLCRKEQWYLLTSIYSVSSAFERDKEEKTINLWSSECHKKARKDVPSSAKCSLQLSLLGQYFSRKRLHSDICLASISAWCWGGNSDISRVWSRKPFAQSTALLRT